MLPLLSATVATIATVGLTVSDLPSQPSQPSRGLFAFSIIGQCDTPTFVTNLVLIADAVFIQQPARFDIQIFVIVALWRNCNSAHRISLDNGFAATEKLLEQYGEPEMTYLKYNIVIDSLVKMQCIELTEEVIWLREWISQKYIYSV